MSHASIQPSACDMEDQFYMDYIFGNQFDSVFPVFSHPIDEHYQAPSNSIRLVHEIYGSKTFNNQKVSQFTGHKIRIGYPSLNWIFMNITDKERNLFHSTYESIKNEILEYGKLSDIGMIIIWFKAIVL